MGTPIREKNFLQKEQTLHIKCRPMKEMVYISVTDLSPVEIYLPIKHLVNIIWVHLLVTIYTPQPLYNTIAGIQSKNHVYLRSIFKLCYIPNSLIMNSVIKNFVCIYDYIWSTLLERH